MLKIYYMKYLIVLTLFYGFSYALTIGDMLQNIGNSISNIGQTLNGGYNITTYQNQNSCQVPPGWQRGNKRGFVNGLPPGLAKKGLTRNCLLGPER